MTNLDRRTFLLGAAGVAGAGAFLAACGDDSSAGGTSSATTSTTNAPTTTQAPLAIPLLRATFPDGGSAPSVMIHGVEQRVAYALHDGNDLIRRNAPESINLEILFDGAPIAGGVSSRHLDGVPTPYFPMYFTPPAAGVYTTVMTQGSETSSHEFLVLEPGETPVPQPGDLLPSVDTPTFDDLQGIDPLCTRVEPCPFHTTNLADALAAGDKPIVLSIATPGFCVSAICGPVIDLLIDQAASRDDLHIIHAEVYTDPHNNPGLTVPIVNDYGLPFEPLLYLARADGTIVRRLDATYDAQDLAESLTLL